MAHRAHLHRIPHHTSGRALRCIRAHPALFARMRRRARARWRRRPTKLRPQCPPEGPPSINQSPGPALRLAHWETEGPASNRRRALADAQQASSLPAAARQLQAVIDSLSDTLPKQPTGSYRAWTCGFLHRAGRVEPDVCPADWCARRANCGAFNSSDATGVRKRKG